MHNILIRDLTVICGSCDYKDFRIVIVHDNYETVHKQCLSGWLYH